MNHGAMRHGGAADRPRSQLPPIEALLVKLEELDDYSHIALRQYPKSERHLLAAETRASLETLLRLAIAAWKHYHKKTTLRDLDIEVAVLRHRVRKAQRMRYITPARYKVWAGHIDELGRMIGGWIRHEKHKH